MQTISIDINQPETRYQCLLMVKVKYDKTHNQLGKYLV